MATEQAVDVVENVFVDRADGVTSCILCGYDLLDSDEDVTVDGARVCEECVWAMSEDEACEMLHPLCREA